MQYENTPPPTLGRRGVSPARVRGDLRGRDDRVDVAADGDGSRCVAVQFDQTWRLVCALLCEVLRVVGREQVGVPVEPDADSYPVGRADAAVCPGGVLGDELCHEHLSAGCRGHGIPLGRCALTYIL